MKPFFTTVGKSLDLMIIPDTTASVNGHPVLTYTYNIYRDRFNGTGQYIDRKETELHLEKKHDPDYLGYITFEQPGKVFTYTSDSDSKLNPEEVDEVIEIINHYRATPGLWLIE